MGKRNGLQTWINDDFVDYDARSEPPIEPDPWESSEAPNPTDQDWGMRQSQVLTHPEETIDSGTLSNSADEPDMLPRDATDSSNRAVEITYDWDDPEPVVDASSDLSESLYPPDDSVTDLSLELKIGELLMRIKPLGKQQRAACTDLLRECGLRRLRYMIPWLSDRTWDGDELRLFLEFRKHWESKPNMHWWECFLWSQREQGWMPRYQRGTLTLGHCHELIQRRSQCTASDVIDNEWLWDWNSVAPWETGVHSFASFAVFRAGVPAGDNWRDYLVRQDDRCELEIAQCLDPTYAPFMIPSFAQQYRLATASSTEMDPWPLASEAVWERAQALGGDFERAWHDLLSGSMNV